MEMKSFKGALMALHSLEPDEAGVRVHFTEERS